VEIQSHISTDARRQQYAIKLILIGGMILALGTVLVAQLYYLLSGHTPNAVSDWLLPAGLGMGVLYGLARQNYSRVSAYLLILCCLVVGVVALLQWSIDLPNGLLDFALIIVMSGRLVGTRQAAIVAAAVIAIMVTVGLLQAAGVVDPDVSWLSDGIETEDTLIFAAIFTAVAWVCWLTNRDADRLLQRAQASEIALRHERDNLEQVVRQRSDELQRLQLERVMELQRFAMIGRQTAGLLHDLVNPIAAVAITLEQLHSEKRTQLLDQATITISQLERYVTAARRQFQKESTHQEFDPKLELQQVVSILGHQAQRANVQLVLMSENGIRLFGDAVRFNQLALNLISNAMDAYRGTQQTGPREVHIRATTDGTSLCLTVADHGCGIRSVDLPRIFEAFYSTKQTAGHGIGIGLCMTREVIEQEFNGQISVTSQLGRGTTFRVELPIPDCLAKDSTPRPALVVSAHQS
jgi:signal transduction histidine kinase